MSRTIYALLIAIDDYPSPIPKLRGCVNDIDAFATYLSERVAKDKGVALKLKTLKNGEATRQAVIDAFSDHLGQGEEGGRRALLLQRARLAGAGPRRVLEARTRPP